MGCGVCGAVVGCEGTKGGRGLEPAANVPRELRVYPKAYEEPQKGFKQGNNVAGVGHRSKAGGRDAD